MWKLRDNQRESRAAQADRLREERTTLRRELEALRQEQSSLESRFNNVPAEKPKGPTQSAAEIRFSPEEREQMSLQQRIAKLAAGFEAAQARAEATSDAAYESAKQTYSENVSDWRSRYQRNVHREQEILDRMAAIEEELVPLR